MTTLGKAWHASKMLWQQCGKTAKKSQNTMIGTMAQSTMRVWCATTTAGIGRDIWVV